MDPCGIDGFWWDYHNPVRLLTFLPATFHSFTGALQLAEPAEHTTFLCVPGPGVPYVILSLLLAEGMEAVVSSVRIGAHTGYPVVYFSDPKLWEQSA